VGGRVAQQHTRFSAMRYGCGICVIWSGFLPQERRSCAIIQANERDFISDDYSVSLSL